MLLLQRSEPILLLYARPPSHEPEAEAQSAEVRPGATRTASALRRTSFPSALLGTVALPMSSNAAAEPSGASRCRVTCPAMFRGPHFGMHCCTRWDLHRAPCVRGPMPLVPRVAATRTPRRRATPTVSMTHDPDRGRPHAPPEAHRETRADSQLQHYIQLYIVHAHVGRYCRQREGRIARTEYFCTVTVTELTVCTYIYIHVK